jgi:uncharacterized protein (TIGR03437 family)
MKNNPSLGNRLIFFAALIFSFHQVTSFAQTRAQLTTFAALGGSPDMYHMTEAPDGSFFIANYSSSSLTRLSATGAVLEQFRGEFIFTTSVVFLSNDVGYTTCNPAPLASRGFCLSGRSGCPRGEGVAPGNINGFSVPRYALGTSGGLTSPTFFVSNGATGEIRRVDPNARSVTPITSGFTIASVNRNTRGPEQMAFNPTTRTLFVVDSGRNTLVAVNETNGNQTVLRNGLNYPFGLALLPNRNLLVANRGDGLLLEISQTGQLVNMYDTGLGADSLRGLTVSARGEIYLLVDRTQTVYRVTLPVVRTVASVSAASYAPNVPLAPEAIVSAFGDGLATATESVTTLPLPTTLAGTTVSVRDSLGVERLAPLFYAAPTQVNYQLPRGTALGQAKITVTSSNGTVSTGTVQIGAVAPGLFTFDSNGRGVAAAVVQRVRGDQSQSIESLASFDATQGRFVALPIDLGPESDQVFLNLFGTGLRFRSSLSNVVIRIGGVESQVTYADAHAVFVGLDQINVRLSRSLLGRGAVDLELLVDGQAANSVRISVR